MISDRVAFWISDMEDHSFEDRSKLVEDLTRMLERGSLSDVKIKLSDGEIFANKDILMARNDFFATMFSNNKFIEGETESVDMDMTDCSKAIMEKIIRFIFSGTIKFRGLSLIQLLELSHMSEMMLIDEIKAEVDIFVKRDYCGNDKFLLELVSGLKFAIKYNLSSLKPWIMMEIDFRMKEIPTDSEFIDTIKILPFEMIVDWRGLSGYSRIVGPITIEVVMVWLSANEATEEQKYWIVDSIDFEDLTVEELVTMRQPGLYPAEKIDERVLQLVKNKDLKIKELEDAIKHIPSHQL